MHVWVGVSGVLKVKICGAINSAPKRKSVPADSNRRAFSFRCAGGSKETGD